MLEGFTPDPVIEKLPSSVQVYVVGGAVRDALLGRTFSDRDWVVTGATVDTMLAAGFRPVGVDFPVFLHPETQEEYALARTERKSGHGYKGFVFHADPNVSLEEDLARRDFTVNAIAMNSAGDLIDPYGGHADLQQKTMRHVSPAFVEDPLRVLRLARFLARFEGFSVAPETEALCRVLCESGELTHLVAERVFAELNKGLGETRPSRMIEFLARLDAWTALGGNSAAYLGMLAKSNLQCLDELDDSTARWVYLLSIPGQRNVVDALCNGWRVPKDIQQATNVFVEMNAFMNDDVLCTQTLARFLERVDVYRKPGRLLMVNGLYMQVHGGKPMSALIDRAVQQIESGAYKQRVAQAIQLAEAGQAIPEAVAQARAAWVTDLLSAIA